MTTKAKTPAVYTRPSKKKRISSGAALGIVIGAVVLIAAIVSILAAVLTSDSGGSTGSQEVAGNVTVTGTILPVLPKSGTDPAVGLEAPTLKGTDFDGAAVEIAPGGKAKLVAVVAHWCPHCQAEVPRLVEWSKSADKPADLEIYGVSTAVDKDLPNYPPSAWLDREGFPGPVLLDEAGAQPGTGGPAAEAYGTSGFPFVVVIGTDGKVKARHAGEFASAGEFNTWVHTALAG